MPNDSQFQQPTPGATYVGDNVVTIRSALPQEMKINYYPTIIELKPDQNLANGWLVNAFFYQENNWLLFTTQKT